MSSELDYAAMNELKSLAPELYNGVKERLLVETVIAAWDQYVSHLEINGPKQAFDDETRVTVDEVNKSLERIQKFYQDNPPA